MGLAREEKSSRLSMIKGLPAPVAATPLLLKDNQMGPLKILQNQFYFAVLVSITAITSLDSHIDKFLFSISLRGHARLIISQIKYPSGKESIVSVWKQEAQQSGGSN